MPPRRRSGSPDRSEGTPVRVEPTDVDPLASLGLWRVRVDIGERSWLIPALDASVWLRVLLDETLDPEAIFPGFCGPDVIVEVNELLISGELTTEMIQESLFDVIEAASGRRWWVTLRLTRTLRAHWDRIGGSLAANGVTPFGVSLSYWLDGAYVTILNLLEKGDPKSVGRFTAQLTLPPPGMAKEVFNRERAVAGFKAAMQRGRRNG